MPKMLGKINPYFRERFGFDGSQKDDAEVDAGEWIDYSEEEEEEEEYSEHDSDESELDDIRHCICDIQELPDHLLAETTVND